VISIAHFPFSKIKAMLACAAKPCCRVQQC